MHLYCFQLHVCKSHLGRDANTAIAWRTFLARTQCAKIQTVFLYIKLSLTKPNNTATEEMKKYLKTHWKGFLHGYLMAHPPINLYIENKIFRHKTRTAHCSLLICIKHHDCTNTCVKCLCAGNTWEHVQCSIPLKTSHFHHSKYSPLLFTCAFQGWQKFFLLMCRTKQSFFWCYLHISDIE